MNPQVLVFAPIQDAHAAAICWGLRQNGVNAVLAPSLRLNDDFRLSVWASAEQFALESSSHQVSFQNLRSIWYRRPTMPESGHCHASDQAFVAGQWGRMQKSVFSLSSDLLDVLWVNRPEVAVRVENKLVQLEAARRVGLDFPETVVTNDANDVKALLRQWSKIVFKTFYQHIWQSASTDHAYSMSVKLLDRESALPESAIAMCPGIYQRYIDKAYDVRVTILGDRYFAVRMRKNNGVAYVDWRDHLTDDDILIEPFDLPAAMDGKLRALMRQLGLVFGCVDLVIDRDGNFNFLEVNQAGQFMFLEEALPQLPFLAAMAAMLGSGRTDYSLDGSSKPSFADYLRTDDYQRVLHMQDQRKLPELNHAMEE